jgi:hypothetical protein
MTPPKVLAMHTRCKKGLIAYHKFNGITVMKKHVEHDHVTLLNFFLKDAVFEVPKSLIYHEPSKKKANVSPFNISGFFFSSFKFKKDDLT